MPDDVLEQFVWDHGTDSEFQRQYGHLDLHALGWQLCAIPAGEVLTCSVNPGFADYVAAVADRTRVVRVEGWGNVNLPPETALHWQQKGTWIRPPVALRGAVLGKDCPFHLVEGHTRLGALRGLVESSMLCGPSAHQIWIGEQCAAQGVEDSWRDVLRRERMPFADWLLRQVDNAGAIGVIASRLIEAQHNSRNPTRIHGDDLPAVLEYARNDNALAPFAEVIVQAHAEWERLMNE
jgi:hypothetical protein